MVDIAIRNSWETDRKFTTVERWVKSRLEYGDAEGREGIEDRIDRVEGAVSRLCDLLVEKQVCSAKEVLDAIAGSFNDVPDVVDVI